MVDVIISNGTVVTMNDERELIEDGAVVVDGREIVDVGPTDRIDREYTAADRVDASDHAVLPGFISAHVHVSGILLRGLGNYRNLYDWLLNVKRPGTSAMDSDDHAVAAALYASEALSTGLTTFVENATGSGGGYDTSLLEAKFDVYDAAGVRNIYAYAFADKPPSQAFVESASDIAMREPDVNHVLPDETVADTQDALDTVESLIQRYHGTADGRQSVWPAPYLATIVTPEGLAGAYELAEKYDVMTTTHTAEDAYNERSRRLSSVEYLRNAGYLGERALLGHCVQVSEADIRSLAVTDTKVAHNTLANCALGSGIAPVPTMQNYGVTVAMGTDNVPNSDTVNMFKDMEITAHLHKGHRRDAGAITAEKVLEMATIDAARAIGRADDLGSLEAGKLADIVLVDLDRLSLTPRPYLPAALVYQTQGCEVDTVLCNGEVVYDDGEIPGLDGLYDDLRATATEAAADVIDRAGLGSLRDRTWTSINE
jgi:cytosine/adenosine deaminase-related metal-dependent hydrolase